MSNSISSGSWSCLFLPFLLVIGLALHGPILQASSAADPTSGIPQEDASARIKSLEQVVARLEAEKTAMARQLEQQREIITLLTMRLEELESGSKPGATSRQTAKRRSLEDSEQIDLRLKEALRLAAGGARSPEAQELISGVLLQYQDQSKLSAEQRGKYQELKQSWLAIEAAQPSAELRQQAQAAFAKLWNTYLREPEAFDQQEIMARDWLSTYGELGMPEKSRVQGLLDGIEIARSATPEEREMLQVKAKVLAAILDKDLWAGQRAVNQMSPEVRAAHPDFVALMEKRLRLKSRQWLGVRKNDVREFLREDKYDAAKARQIAIDTIITRLIHSTIEDYLATPDQYSQARNQEAELKTQALLRQLLIEFPAKY